jgi:hypothetical protein
MEEHSTTISEEPDMNRDRQPTAHAEQGTLRKYRVVLIGFLLVTGYFLLTEHRAHIIPFLPYLLLAACPLMHVFMHHGHGHGRLSQTDKAKEQGDG